MSASMSVSKSERSYIQASLQANPPVRADGRSLQDYRTVLLETGIAPLANGGARVSIGKSPQERRRHRGPRCCKTRSRGHRDGRRRRRRASRVECVVVRQPPSLTVHVRRLSSANTVLPPRTRSSGPMHWTTCPTTVVLLLRVPR